MTEATALPGPGSPKFLDVLPPEVRNHIYRLVVNQTSSIRVDTSGLTEPNLLTVSKQIRAEAGSLFYSENKFKVRLHFYSSAALRFWANKRQRVAAEFKVRKVHTKVTTLKHEAPHWPNLLQFLRDVYDGTVHHYIQVPTLRGGVGSVKVMLIARMFLTVTRMKDRPWEMVEALLLEDREILETIEPGWKT